MLATLTPSSLLALSLSQARGAIAAWAPWQNTPELERAHQVLNVLDQPEVVDRYKAAHGVDISQDTSKESTREIVQQVFGPGTMERRRWLAPAAFASLSVVSARASLPHLDNAIRSVLGMAETALPADHTALLNALVLAVVGTIATGGASALVPVQKPITIRWPYATPWRRFTDYVKVTLINGPVVGVQQQTEVHFPDAKVANETLSWTLNFILNFLLFIAFMSLSAKPGHEPELSGAVTSFTNGALLAFGQVYCAKHITKKMIGNPVATTVARLVPGFFFLSFSGVLKSPDLFQKISELSGVDAFAVQLGSQAGFSALVSLATFMALRNRTPQRT